jgi:hypothetical protein
MEFKQTYLDIFANISMDSLMHFIDTIKDKLSDAEYNVFSEKINNLKNKKLIPVRIWFMKPVAWMRPELWAFDDDEMKILAQNCQGFYDLYPRNSVVMMSLEDFEKHKTNIDTTPSHTSDYYYVNVSSNIAIENYKPDCDNTVSIYNIEMVDQYA